MPVYIKNLTNLPIFYLSFLSFIFFNFLLNILNFNENFLIGSLFTIGFFTVLQLIHSLYAQALLIQLTNMNKSYLIRRLIIYKYKFYLAKLTFFYLIFFLTVRYKIIVMKFETLFNLIITKFDKNNYIIIFLKILYLNLLNTYFYIEKSLFFTIQLLSIKTAYNSFF